LGLISLSHSKTAISHSNVPKPPFLTKTAISHSSVPKLPFLTPVPKTALGVTVSILSREGVQILDRATVLFYPEPRPASLCAYSLLFRTFLICTYWSDKILWLHETPTHPPGPIHISSPCTRPPHACNSSHIVPSAYLTPRWQISLPIIFNLTPGHFQVEMSA
jgi:hypothetical protein